MSASRPTSVANLLASLQPVGIATAQILSFCAANSGEVSFADAVPALVVAVVATLALSLLAWPVFGGARQGALIASLLAFGFWAVAPLVGVFASAMGDRPDIAAVVLIGGGLSLVAAIGVWLRRTAANLSPAYRVVDAVSLLGFAVPALALLASAATGSAPPHATEIAGGVAASSAPRGAGEPGGPGPDIYHIVLDAYGRDDELAEHFGIARGLGARLRERGFYVAADSRSNYDTTLHSIPSLLNYDFVQSLLADKRIRQQSLVRLIKTNRWIRGLRMRGYRAVSYDTGINLTRLTNVDEYIKAPPALEMFGVALRPSYFERGLLDLTAAAPFVRQSSALSPYSLHRARILHAFRDLPRHAALPEPTFVFAHFLSPHEPFVFGRNGEDVSPRHLPYKLNTIFADPDLPREAGKVGPEYARRYAAQAQYIADLVVECVDAILEKSPEPPIIIVHGDHGPYGFSPNTRQPRFAILNAYYLPGNASARLYPSISPVNTARVILNEYFGADLPLLEDRSFHTDWLKPGEFAERD